MSLFPADVPQNTVWAILNTRRSPSFGILPVHLTADGKQDDVFEGAHDPFYTVDSRSWQVINPDKDRFDKMGMKILALEKDRPYVDLPRALMAIRFTKEFIATQFHPEADPHGVKNYAAARR